MMLWHWRADEVRNGNRNDTECANIGWFSKNDEAEAERGVGRGESRREGGLRPVQHEAVRGEPRHVGHGTGEERHVGVLGGRRGARDHQQAERVEGFGAPARDGITGGLDEPPVEVVGQVGPLGHRADDLRAEHAARRVVPRGTDHEPGHGVGRERDDGLEGRH